MGLVKYTLGRILRNDEEKQEQKIAASNFSDKDREALRQENQDEQCGHDCQCSHPTLHQ